MIEWALALALQQATLRVPPLPANGPPSIIVGADFARKCASDIEDDRTYCAGYLTGLHDTLIAIRAGETPLYCIPASASQTYVASMVGGFIEARADLWSEPAAEAIASSLIELFPCGTIEGPDGD